MNILIIYDLAMNRAIIERFLRMDGHITVGVSRVEDPKQMLINKNRFDLVICDLLRPETDGVQIYKDYLKMLKSTNSGDQLRVLPFLLVAAALTEEEALRSAGKYKHAKAIGFYDILTKPLDHNRLRTCLSRIESEVKPKDEAAHLGNLPQILKVTTQDLIRNHNERGVTLLIKLLEACLFKIRSLK
ncbi:response regulator [Candidatus Neomarinimicrobiota bacterium]